MPRYSLLLALLLISTTVAAQEADLALSVKIASTPFHNTPTRLELTVTNHGPAAATNVAVTSFEALDDRLDARCRRLSGHPEFRCTATEPLAAGQSLTFTAATGIFSTIRPMTFHMAASAAQHDPVAANNEQVVIVDSLDHTSAGMSIDPPPSLDANRTGTARVTFENRSSFEATGLVLTLGINQLERILRTDPGVTCGPLLASFGRINVDCILPSIPANSSREFAFDLQFARETRIHFFAFARWGGLRFDAPTDISRNYSADFPVTHGGDSGAGSLREAITDANAACTDPLRICRIELGVDGAIRPLAPLPAIAAEWIVIDGRGKVELDGSAVAGDGLVVTSKRAEIRDLAITGFRGHGILIDPRTPAQGHILQGSYDVERCRIRVGGRGVMIMAGDVRLTDNDLSGNGRSGAFVWSSRLAARGNRLSDNGASGIFVGPRPGGTGPTTLEDNTIENNGEFGIALAPSSIAVVRRNRIARNVHGGIDLGLDGPTLGTTAAGLPVAAIPVIESARFDGTVTVIEAVAPAGGAPFGAVSNAVQVDFYANDPADPEAEQFLGTATLADGRFRLEAGLDLRGKWITAVALHTRIFFGGEYSDQVSSELSRAYPVN
jgi:parallel beta-helix repeat protein